jgi:hypothetical protein
MEDMTKGEGAYLRLRLGVFAASDYWQQPTCGWASTAILYACATSMTYDWVIIKLFIVGTLIAEAECWPLTPLDASVRIICILAAL